MVEKSPSMPFYGKQFYDDESVWLSSLAHQGLYLALLWNQWANGSVPSDVSLIARLVGQRESDVRRLWKSLSCHFSAHPDDADRLINPQLEKIRAEMLRLRATRSNSGSKGAANRQAKLQATLLANADPPNGDGEGDGDSSLALGEGEREGEFAAAWSEYPRKRGRDAALRHFESQVTTRAEAVALHSAIRNYRQEIDLLGVEDRFVLHGSTFFNGRWREYVDGAWKPPSTEAKNGKRNSSAATGKSQPSFADLGGKDAFELGILPAKR